MPRHSFYIYKETTSGAVVIDHDTDISQLALYKSGSLDNKWHKVKFPDIRNNGDGTYNCLMSGSGLYQMLLNGLTQAEFSWQYIPDSDSLTEDSVDNTSIGHTNGKLEIFSGSLVIYTSSLVDNLTSTADSASLTANQGSVLKGYTNNKLNLSDEYLTEANITQEFTSSDLTLIQSAESMQIEFSDTAFLGNQNTYVGGLRILDTEVRSVVTQSTTWRNYLAWGLSGSYLIKNDTVRFYANGLDSVLSGSYYMPTEGRITRASVRGYVPSTGSGDFSIILRIEINSTQSAIANFNYDASELGYVTSGSIGGYTAASVPFTNGAQLQMILDMEENDNDPILMGDFAVILEATYE